MNSFEAKRILETALICATQSMSLKDMALLFNDQVEADTLKRWLQEIELDWAQKGLELVNLSTGWRFQSRPSMRTYLDRLHPEKPPKYSRAVMETLAIIAYRQPVTRGDMEDIRGVTINSLVLKQLEDRGWVEVIGHRETVGRPALYATTRQFLDDLGLSSLDQLPVMETPNDPSQALAQLGETLETSQLAMALDENAPASSSDETPMPAESSLEEDGVTELSDAHTSPAGDLLPPPEQAPDHGH